LGEDRVKEEKVRTQQSLGTDRPKSILSILTDFIFVSIAVYLLLNYVSTLLTHAETTLVVIREAFLTTYLLMGLTLLAVRNRARAFASRKRDYAYAILGLGSPLLFQLTPRVGPPYVGLYLEFLGLVLIVTAFVSLNRSFGVAPENRGIKTGGVYKFVRHPMYLGYILTETGYVVENPSAFNLFILTVSALFLILRLLAEERLLQEDQAYRRYARKTKWRLLPLVF
jgi:protein-S-isoprenylcysteine O-methyltransferase Ste14